MDRASPPPICDSRCIGTTHVSGAREAEGEGGQAPGRAGLLGGVWSVGRGWGRERPRRVTSQNSIYSEASSCRDPGHHWEWLRARSGSLPWCLGAQPHCH